MNLDEVWGFQHKIKKQDIVVSNYDKTLMRGGGTFIIPKGSTMVILSDPLFQTCLFDDILSFLVLSCAGVGWIRIAKASSQQLISGYLTLVE